MKRFSIIVSFIAAATLSLLSASCGKEADAPVSGSVPGAILFTQEGIDVNVARTRADVVDTLGAFGVVATTGEAGSEAAAWDPAEASFSRNGGTAFYEGGKMWPDSDPGYHFYASNSTMTAGADGCTVSADGTKDVICAYVQTPTYNRSNKLVFEHIYARIGEFSLTAKEGYTVDKVSAKISCPVTGTYNLRTGAGKADGTGWAPGDTVAHALANGANDIWVLPGTSCLLTVEYEITENATGEVTLFKGDGARTAHVGLTAGYINKLSGEADAEGGVTNIRFTVEIRPWGEKTVGFDWD